MRLARSIGIVVLVRSAVLLASIAAASEVGPVTEPESGFSAPTPTSMRTVMARMEGAQLQAPEEQSMDMPSIDGLIVLPTQRTVADVLARAVSIATTRGITVFAKIDFSGDAAHVNLKLRPTGLVILGSPAAGTPVMAATPTVAIDLPLKILAFEDSDGHTWVAYNDPKYLQRRHGFSEALVKNLAPIGGLAQAAAGAD